MMRSESEFTEFENFQNVVWFYLFKSILDSDSDILKHDHLMNIEFDPIKNLINYQKHGVYLTDAASFEWESAIIW